MLRSHPLVRDICKMPQLLENLSASPESLFVSPWLLTVAFDPSGSSAKGLDGFLDGEVLNRSLGKLYHQLFTATCYEKHGILGPLTFSVMGTWHVFESQTATSGYQVVR